MAVAFGVIATWPLIKQASPRWWSVALAIVFALAALAMPKVLAPLNKLWTRLGVLLGSIVSPIALAVVFFGAVMPLGVLMRLTGKDPMRLKRDAAAKSYWVPREPPGPPPTSMTNQF